MDIWFLFVFLPLQTILPWPFLTYVHMHTGTGISVVPIVCDSMIRKKHPKQENL